MAQMLAMFDDVGGGVVSFSFKQLGEVFKKVALSPTKHEDELFNTPGV